MIVRSKQIWKFFIYNKLLAIKFVPLRIHIFLQLLQGIIIINFLPKMLKEKNGFDYSLAAFENRKAEIKSQLFNPT